MKKIGALLKAEREKKKLSLHEVGMALKINPKILKAIEEAESKNLPAKTFLRGFVRSYAQYLRMDVDNILTIFQNEVGSTRPEEPKSQQSPDSSPSNSTPSENLESDEKLKSSTTSAKSEKVPLPNSGMNISGQKIYTVIGSLILILMIVFVAKMVDKYQKESQRVKIESAIPITLDDKDPQDTPLSIPTSLTSSESSAELMTPISSESNSDKNAPTTTPTPTPGPVATHTPLPTPAATSSPTPTPALQKTTEVIVEALNKVEIRYSFGDEKWESITLVADQLHTFKSKSGVFLEITDGAAVNLIVNGRDRGVPGSMGKPIKLSYPK
jgi:cytoskeleton protein RodZ